MIVIISFLIGEEEVDVRNCKDGNYIGNYKLMRVGRYDIEVKVNGWLLIDSFWIVNVTLYFYKVVRLRGLYGEI